MSTLATTNIKHPSSASNNIVLDSAGGVDLDALTVSGSAPADSVNIDASGKLLVGTSSSVGANSGRLQIKGAAGGVAPFAKYSLVSANDEDAGGIALSSSGTNSIAIQADPDNLRASSDISFAVDGTERMRIKSNGDVGTFGTVDSFLVASSGAAGVSVNLILGKHSATSVFSGTTSFVVRTNGNVINTNNSYGSISDAKLKENVVDAGSQWSDLKALQVRKYNFKEGQTHTQIGLVAQEVELVSPGLVSESPDRDAEDNDLGTVTKSVNYSVLYMKAVKALQEAMERIEQLETEMAAVKAQLS